MKKNKRDECTLRPSTNSAIFHAVWFKAKYAKLTVGVARQLDAGYVNQTSGLDAVLSEAQARGMCTDAEWVEPGIDIAVSPP
jgi:hypothetical protein